MHTLVIFTKNELDGIIRLYSLIPFHMFGEVLVVDGRSNDGTVEFLQSKGIPFYEQVKPGRANAALEAMCMTKGDDVLFLSGDGNEDPRDIPKLLDLIQRNDMVIASRFMKGGKSDDSDDFFRIRRLTSIVIARLVSFIWRTRVTDATNGLRTVSRSLWNRCRVTGGYHTVELQLTIQSAKMGARMVEVPTVEGARAGHPRYASTLGMAKSLLGVFLAELFGGRWREGKSVSHKRPLIERYHVSRSANGA